MKNQWQKKAGLFLGMMACMMIPSEARAEENVLQNDEMSAIMETGMTAVPGWQLEDGKWFYIEETGTRHTGWLQDGTHWYFLDGAGWMVTGWRDVDGKYYYFKEDGKMETGSRKDGETVYSFQTDGSLNYAKKEKNTGGGSYTVGFYNQACQELADSLNELKAEDFDGDEDDDYYEDEKKDYDKDASFIIDGRLTEIAQHRILMARSKGYGSGKIPDEGTLEDYLKSIGFGSSRRMMEVYLTNCDGATEAEEKLLRKHDSEEKKRKDRAVYYKEMGIAHENVNGKDYYMIIFMR